ncbi:CoA transferase [Acidisoma cellulosilytica]|uniref:CoA transferase n=1 Tax=Acidisoma cellulosilyticum TaxID=2802395 RepID=A0A963Z0T2_9PROT|nr:CaiB/BaiF CoA-transferase family protein [Acidisoma cellulosilyticum]MCB8879912.1 CoA transferase [Acidisoma cellulosilyticum]
MAGALSHIRVLDLSRVLAGPWASQLLGDLGAEIIKIERPGSGDDTRAWGPPFLQDSEGQDTRDAAYFLCANRNKQSVTVDFTKPEGQALVRDLARQSDVVLENFKVGGLAQYGLDYESLAAINSGLVYCSITGFGQTGPYAERAGYDFLIQGMGGLMSITGRREGEPGAGPQKVGVALTDVMTGLYASNAILAALLHRDISGCGQYIDLALLDVQVASLANQTMNYLTTGRSPQRMGNAHPNIVPYQDFPTLDGAMILAVGNDGQFAKLAIVAGHPDWALKPEFSTNRARVENRAAFVAAFTAVSITRTTKDWISALEAAGVPCGPINTLAEVFEDPQVISRGTRVTLPHAAGVDVALVANPIRMSETPPEYRSAPPTLGQHTKAVLAEKLGLDEAAIALLIAKGVV